jgi:glutaredoxin
MVNGATEEQKRSLRRIRIAIFVMFAICAALAAFVYWQDLPPPAHEYDALAQCIAKNGATFYGASWCPHCADQKTKFGTGAHYLPYVECALPSGGVNATSGNEAQVCIDHGITQYPTWVFADGSRLVGVQTPQTLATKTGCAL